MNKVLYIFLAIFFFAQCTPKVKQVVSNETPAAAKNTEVFRHMAPEPGPAPQIQMGTYETFKLDNGLQVIVVENNKLPRVSFSLTVDRSPINEGDKAGLIDMTGDLMSRGTKNKNKAELDEALDFIGARFNTSGSGMFASSLKKHTETLLSIASDVLLNPTFNVDELEKLRKQAISGLQSEKDDPNAIMGNVRSKLLYGGDHPYGEIITEESLAKIKASDCKEYYDTYFKPNISYLVVTGDIDLASARKLADQYFGAWKKGNIMSTALAPVKMPETTTVDFVNKAGAVQSVINIAYPVDLSPGAPDAIKANVMNTILGGYFRSRINANLREDKAYTYGVRSNLRTDRVIGAFRAGGSVRNEVTDSSITELLYEINRLSKESVPMDELKLVKNYMSGSFARSLERPETVARYALNTFRYNLPKDYYQNYLKNLNDVSSADVLMMAKKYLKPDAARIIVVGNKGDVAKNLEKFSASRKVDYYDYYGVYQEPLDDVAVNDITAEEVVENYISAMGGRAALSKVNNIQMKMSMDMMGQAVDVDYIQAQGGKLLFTMNAQGMTMMKQVSDGTKAIAEQMGQKVVLEGEQLEAAKDMARMFPELTYKERGMKMELKGIESIDNQKAYELLMTTASGKTSTHYFSMENGFKIREISVQGEGQQTVTVTQDLADYKEVNGISFPHTLTTTGAAPFPMKMMVQEIQMNKDIDMSLFKVE